MTITRYFKLFWFFRKLSLMKAVEYRTQFYFWIFIQLAWTIFTFLFFHFIFQITPSIGPWGQWEVYTLISVYTMFEAFLWSVMSVNMWEYTQQVHSGELSLWLTKPIDTPFIFLTRQGNLDGVFKFAAGLLCLLYSLQRVSTQPTLTDWFFFIVFFIIGLGFVYFLWFSISTIAFYVERLNNINEVVPGFRRLWQVPDTIFEPILSPLAYLVFPLGLITVIPTRFLLQNVNYTATISLLAWTVVLFFFSRWFFYYSVRNYTSSGN